MAADSIQDRTRREGLKEAVLNRRMLICVFTGFTSGLPLFVLFQLVPGWLRVEGVGLAEIGFFALVQFPFTWKFLWSPVMDRFTLPFLGHRRGWMLVTQVALLLSMGVMGFIKPDLSIWTVAYLAATIAFFSASQDIVLDAYRRELLPDVELGLGNSIHVQAYRLSGLIPGSLALILADHLPWHTVFIIVALFMGVGMIMTLVIDEAIADPSPPKTMREAIVEPFREFVQRKGVGPAFFKPCLNHAADHVGCHVGCDANDTTSAHTHHGQSQDIVTRQDGQIASMQNRAHTLNGARAQNKGLALFPRRIGGHYVMCSRIDGENLYLMYSDMVHFWETAELLLAPKHP